MNLHALREIVLQTQDIRPIGRTWREGGRTAHVMGLSLRPGGELELLLLEHDEAYQDRCEETDLAKAAGPPATNREAQRRVDDGPPRFTGVQRARLGDRGFHVTQSESRRCAFGDPEIAAPFIRFLLGGWDPGGIGEQDLDYVFLTRLSLEGTFDAIPVFDPSPLSVSTRPDVRHWFPEQPVVLPVGEDFPEKCLFSGGESGREGWLQINRVYLFDPWRHLEQVCADPRAQAQMTGPELAERKARIQASFEQTCPEGTRLAVVEYECEENLSVQFFSRDWLDAAPRRGMASSLGIIGTSGPPVGKLGLKLKSCVMPDPVPPETRQIDAELFRCSVTTPGAEFTI